ncbi:MAG TPA: hypothetical protein VEL76_36280 [Gemmataceae bacterium]|nr:hypothetical protein [Gemmataceae bacterium]
MGSNLTLLRQELESRVQLRTGRRVRNLAIDVSPERILLQGQATSYHVKQLAQHGVQEYVPDAQLENAIVVSRVQ